MTAEPWLLNQLWSLLPTLLLHPTHTHQSLERKRKGCLKSILTSIKKPNSSKQNMMFPSLECHSPPPLCPVTTPRPFRQLQGHLLLPLTHKSRPPGLKSSVLPTPLHGLQIWALGLQTAHSDLRRRPLGKLATKPPGLGTRQTAAWPRSVLRGALDECVDLQHSRLTETPHAQKMCLLTWLSHNIM